MTALAVPLFDGAELTLSDPPTTLESQRALATFLTLSPADRMLMTRHLYAYYRDFQEWAGEEPGPESPMAVAPTPETIWSQIHPRSLFLAVDECAPGNPVYVVVEGDCDWEEEHGLMLCFLEGRVLAKCGGYDGHLTHRNATLDDRLADVVYRAHDPRYTTRRDP